MYYDNHTAKHATDIQKIKESKYTTMKIITWWRKLAWKEDRHYKTERKQDGKNKPSLSINNYFKYKLIKFSKDREWLNGLKKQDPIMLLWESHFSFKDTYEGYTLLSEWMKKKIPLKWKWKESTGEHGVCVCVCVYNQEKQPKLNNVTRGTGYPRISRSGLLEIYYQTFEDDIAL